MSVRKSQSLQQHNISATDNPLTIFQREIFFPTDSTYFDAIDGEELKHRFPSAGRYIEFDPLPFLKYIPDLEAEIFWLAFKRDKYQKDIAAMLGLSVITVSYRYRRAIQKIGYLMVIEALNVKAVLAEVPFLTDRERSILYDLFYYVNQDMVGKLYRNEQGQPLRQSLALDTPILTKRGWQTMSSVQVGDQVRHPSGGWTEVVDKSQVFERESYALSFIGTSETIKVDGDHIWKVFARDSRSILNLDNYRTGNSECVRKRFEDELVISTSEMLSYVRAENKFGLLRFRIPLSKSFVGNESVLPVPPYAFGCWLGDGVATAPYICVWEQAIVDRLKQDLPDLEPLKSYASNGRYKSELLKKGLRALGFADYDRSLPKHIPSIYREASELQRRELLAGLIDTDGSVVKRNPGHTKYTSVRHQLALDVWEIALSLGLRANLCEGKAYINGKCYGSKWVVSFTASNSLSVLARKAICSQRPWRLSWRIKDIKPIGIVQTQCIKVAAEDGMFLAGRSLIPTHNSTVKWYFIKFQNKVRKAERLEPERWLKPLILIQFLERHFTMRVRAMAEEEKLAEPVTESFAGTAVELDSPDAYALMPVEDAMSVEQMLLDAS